MPMHYEGQSVLPETSSYNAWLISCSARRQKLQSPAQPADIDEVHGFPFHVTMLFCHVFADVGGWGCMTQHEQRNEWACLFSRWKCVQVDSELCPFVVALLNSFKWFIRCCASLVQVLYQRLQAASAQMLGEFNPFSSWYPYKRTPLTRSFNRRQSSQTTWSQLQCTVCISLYLLS
jgi:hypothetical protein